ncbi:MAG TPA: RIP metalloprotease RseP [Terriglobia bacterium]|nr:RIP metalloprotease RseP [Terriglobia bacterium]
MTLVSNFFTDTAVAVVVLGFMIFIHELGHFMAAKRLGVRVPVFSLGFGKRLFGFKRGETDYRVSLLPLGGYVKMAGEDPSEPHTGDPGDFLAHPRWQRFVIAVMGPVMNIATAIILLSVLYKYHFQKPAYEEQPARIGEVDGNSPAAKAGLQPGDLVVQAGDLRNPTWEDFELKVITTTGEPIPMEVNRDGRLLQISLTPQAEGADQTGFAGLYPCLPNVIGAIEPGLPAIQAGIKPGDKIVAIDGKPVACFGSLAETLQGLKGQWLDLTVLRASHGLHFQVRPVYRNIQGKQRWVIGVDSPRMDVVVRQLPWNRAIATAVDDNIRNTMATFDVLEKILTRHMSPRSLSSPIGIAQISGEAYRSGIPDLLMLVSFISLQLGIFNLLPIPILDGGMILMLGIEGLMRRDLSLKVKERVVQVGMVFLLLLAVFAVYNDIIKTIKPY